MWIYLAILIALFILELIYFKIADRFNIIDKPNARSSHSSITLRGGGVLFYVAGLMYFIISGYQYPWFFIGLTLMTIVSFIDDIITLSNRIRLLVHFSSVLLMAYQLELFEMPWYYLLGTFVLVVGVINAYNFMDGINGITAGYSLAVCSLLVIVNQTNHFIDNDLLVYTMLGLLVFAFFNFRIKAKCFAGDVGSVSIAFILLFALGKLIIETNTFLYILFLAVYGVDVVWTVLRRLSLRENIFKAHRSHLYQFLANEAGFNKLLVSLIYAVIQLIIGLGIIYFADKDATVQWVFAAVVLIVLSGLYLLLKAYIIKKYVNPAIK